MTELELCELKLKCLELAVKILPDPCCMDKLFTLAEDIFIYSLGE